MPSLTGNQSSSPDSPETDPPPRIRDPLGPVGPDEEHAVHSWMQRNSTYITTIPWYKYDKPHALAFLWGYPDAEFRIHCISVYMFYTRMTGRKLTDDERDAILEPAARSAAAATYDRPIALGLGSWLMARSWAKSGAKENVRKAAAAAAADARPVMGTGLGGSGALGADGHITHFSTPQQHTGQFGSGAGSFGNSSSSSSSSSMGRALGQLFKRAGRASVPGLLCFVGLQWAAEPYHEYLTDNENLTMAEDLRLMRQEHDMRKNMIDHDSRTLSDGFRRNGF
jgi:hypothetical protein